MILRNCMIEILLFSHHFPEPIKEIDKFNRVINVTSRQIASFNGQMKLFGREMRRLSKEGYEVHIVSNERARHERIHEYLEDAKIFGHFRYDLGLLGSGMMLDDEKLLKQQYEVVAGKWPKESTEAVLVLNKDGSIPDFTLYQLGYYDRKEYDRAMIKYRETGKLEMNTEKQKPFRYRDALKLSYSVISPGEIYSYNSPTGTWLDQSKNKASWQGSSKMESSLKL